MIKRIFDFLYYTTYISISKTNKTSPEKTSAGLLAIMVMINIVSLYFLFENHLPNIAFYFIAVFGIIISGIILYYFTENSGKIIIENSVLKKSKTSSYLVGFYPDVSILLFFFVIGVSVNTILILFGALILLRIITFFTQI